MLCFAKIRFRVLLPILLFLPSGAAAQQTAVLTPDGSDTSRRFAAALESGLKEIMPVTDSELAAAVLKTRNPDTPFNLSDREARFLGHGIGCSYYVLVRGATIRRSSFERKQFFEAYAAVYLIESRSGDMILWRLFNAEEDDGETALNALLLKASGAATLIGRSIAARTSAYGANGKMENRFPVTEDEDNIRLPLPYRRIKPEYTKTADYYGVEATVDIEVGIDREGRVTSTRIVRWAGFGLDESVDQTVRAMNWRAADRRGKTLAVTVLLRYNFKDLDNKDPSR